MQDDLTWSAEAAAVLEKKQARAALRRGYFGLSLRLALCALSLFLLFSQLFLLHRAADASLSPAIQHGDLLLALRPARSFPAGSVILYREDGVRRLARVAAREGDRITLESGSLLVNGTRQTGVLLQDLGVLASDFFVPSGCVLATFQDAAAQQRAVLIDVQQIDGTVFSLLRRRGL